MYLNYLQISYKNATITPLYNDMRVLLFRWSSRTQFTIKNSKTNLRFNYVIYTYI